MYSLDESTDHKLSLYPGTVCPSVRITHQRCYQYRGASWRHCSPLNISIYQWPLLLHHNCSCCCWWCCLSSWPQRYLAGTHEDSGTVICNCSHTVRTHWTRQTVQRSNNPSNKIIFRVYPLHSVIFRILRLSISGTILHKIVKNRMNESRILPPCPACADCAAWSCFTPRSDLRQRKDKARHSALWLSLCLSCLMSCYLWLTRDAVESTKAGKNPSDNFFFFQRFHLEFLSFIWCRKTGRFDGWNHKYIMQF